MVPYFGYLNYKSKLYLLNLSKNIFLSYSKYSLIYFRPYAPQHQNCAPATERISAFDAELDEHLSIWGSQSAAASSDWTAKDVPAARATRAPPPSPIIASGDEPTSPDQGVWGRNVKEILKIQQKTWKKTTTKGTLKQNWIRKMTKGKNRSQRGKGPRSIKPWKRSSVKKRLNWKKLKRRFSLKFKSCG